jgi:hypothetical protein
MAIAVMCVVSAAIGALCIDDSLESRTFFSSELSVPGMVYVALAALGAIMLWRTSGLSDEARVLRWFAHSMAVVLVLTSLLTVYVMTLGFGSA